MSSKNVSFRNKANRGNTAYHLDLANAQSKKPNVGVVPDNAEALLLEEQGGFAKVKWQNQEIWVNKVHLVSTRGAEQCTYCQTRPCRSGYKSCCATCKNSGGIRHGVECERNKLGIVGVPHTGHSRRAATDQKQQGLVCKNCPTRPRAEGLEFCCRPCSTSTGQVHAPACDEANENTGVDANKIILETGYRLKLVGLGKFLAAVLRALVEDFLNATLQMIYLCKVWKEKDMSSRAFTMCSVATSVFCAFYGIYKEMSKLQKLQLAHPDLEDFRPVNPPMDGIKELKPAPAIMPEAQGLLADEPDRQSGVLGGYAELSARQVFELEALEKDKGKVIIDQTITSLLNGQVARGRLLHKMLMCAALMYWVLHFVILLPIDFIGINCSDKELPSKPFIFFFASAAMGILVELWALIHCKYGYELFSNLRLSFFENLAFGLLGRFDLFGDVTNARMVWDCVDIRPDHFKWFSIWEHKFPLPLSSSLGWTLGTWMTLSITFTFVIQAIPALGFLLLHKFEGANLALVLKLNEFTLLLTAMEEELDQEMKFAAGEEGDLN